MYLPHKLIDGDLGVIQQQLQGVDGLPQIVGRNIGGHPHGNSRGTVDQQVGKAGGEHHRLHQALVKIGAEIDGVFMQIGQKLHGDGRHPGFGVAHRRRRIPVQGAKVPVPVHQGVADGEILGHAHQGIIQSRLPVGVILAQNLADDAGGFAVGLIRRTAHFQHGIENAPVHRLQTVPHIGQGPAHNYAHGIVQERALYFIVNGNRYDFVLIRHSLLLTALKVVFNALILSQFPLGEKGGPVPPGPLPLPPPVGTATVCLNQKARLESGRAAALKGLPCRPKYPGSLPARHSPR